MASKIIQLLLILLSLESVERKENFTKLRYQEYKKSFLDQIKNIFLVFESLILGKKNKNSGHKFYNLFFSESVFNKIYQLLRVERSREKYRPIFCYSYSTDSHLQKYVCVIFRNNSILGYG